MEVVLGSHPEPALHNFVSGCHGSVHVPVLPGGREHGRDVEGVLHPLLDVNHHRAKALVFNLYLTCCGKGDLPEKDKMECQDEFGNQGCNLR